MKQSDLNRCLGYNIVYTKSQLTLDKNDYTQPETKKGQNNHLIEHLPSQHLVLSWTMPNYDTRKNKRNNYRSINLENF